MKFQEHAQSRDACPEAVIWIGERTIQQAYDECERADWMLWMFGSMVGRDGWPTREELVLATCDCAETVRHLWPMGDACANALRVARSWAAGDATLDEARGAADAAYDDDDDDAANAAAYANAAAAYATAAAGAASAAAASVAYASVTAAAAGAAAAGAAAAGADGAARATAADVRRDAHLQMCALIRTRLRPGPI